MQHHHYSILTITAFALVHANSSLAFDDVTQISAMAKGPVKTLEALPNGLSVTYANGELLRLNNVDHPKNGSPVNYKYMEFDDSLQAYVIDVWRVGKQTVLLSKETGAAAEVGHTRAVSPNQRLIFSTDCLETGCYYQLTQWPTGKRLTYSQSPATTGKHASVNIVQSIDAASINWQGNTQVAFEMPCEFYGPTLQTAPAKLVTKGKEWRLQPSNPCQ